MRGHVREETALRGVRVLILEDIEDTSQVSVHEVEGVVAAPASDAPWGLDRGRGVWKGVGGTLGPL